MVSLVYFVHFFGVCHQSRLAVGKGSGYQAATSFGSQSMAGLHAIQNHCERESCLFF